MDAFGTKQHCFFSVVWLTCALQQSIFTRESGLLGLHARSPRWRGSRLFTTAVLIFICTATAFAAAPLFPQPLHLTRTIDDPSTGQPTVVEEYCFGNRVVSVSGEHTVIADYEKHEITDIDRAGAKYSVISFDQLAQAMGAQKATVRSAAAISEKYSMRSIGRRGAVANADYFEAQPSKESDLKKIEVGVDSSVRLSKDAAEVLIGSAYPRNRSDETELVMRAASPSGGGPRIQSQSAGGGAVPETYGLPVEQSLTYTVGTKSVVMRNRVTRIGNELPPPEVLNIPNGAKLAEAKALETRRVLDELDQKPTDTRRRP